MSWGRAKLPTTEPAPAGVQSEDAASNEQAVPVPWWIGPDWRPLTWIVPEAYNIVTKEVRQKVGKGGSQVTGHEVWGDVAGIAGLGLGRAVKWLEIGSEVVWAGNIVRNDDPEHPDYWRAHILCDRAEAYVYWGRPDQPEDDILLGPLGASDATRKHPAYRNQILVVLKSLFFGSNASAVPSVRVYIERAPVPEIGDFPALASGQGESIVAGALELTTNPIFGAAVPAAAHLVAADWEAVSAAVVAQAGAHAPLLTRARPLRDVLREFAEYYDGFFRLDNGKIKPGLFPHDGEVPAGLTELSVHDFTTVPSIEVLTPASVVNDVVVFCRDVADFLKKKPVPGSDSASVEARRGHEPETLEMLGIIDLAQGARYAAERAATRAEMEMEGEITVRRAKAFWGGGARLKAGDNFNLDYLQLQLDQVSRIVRRVDPYRGSPTIEFVAERGVFPSPYVPPSDLKPAVARVLPLAIESARVLELTPALAGSPLGLPVAFIAKRPPSELEGTVLTAASVLGFNVWYSPDGGSYDTLGLMPGWGVRGVVREAIANAEADLTVKLTLDADNLDLGRLAAQSASGQANDTLLIVIGEELFSVGAIALAGLDYDLTCKRVRLGSLPAAHAVDDVAWLVWRDELRSFLHKGFIEDQTRYFKLQPYTQSAVLELADVDALEYHFRDRAPELPVIEIDALPAGPVVGTGYNISGEISDVNGDLVSYQIHAAKLVDTGGAVDSEVTLQSGDVKPADRALMTFKAPLVFPSPGFWVIIVRAYDVTGGFSELVSDEMEVGVGSGFYGPDDGITPDTVDDVLLTSGLGLIVAEWTAPTNTPIRRTRIYFDTVAVKPATPQAVVDDPQAFFFLDSLPSSTTVYFWFEVEAKNGRMSAVVGPFNATTRAGIDLSDIVPGMELVGIVGALPNPVGYTGPKTVLLTSDGKIYRYSAGAWTAAVPTVDLSGQIASGQIADAAILQAKLADNAVSQAKLQDGIVSTSKLVDAAITAVKIGTGAVEAAKLAANAVTEAAVAAGAITTTKIGDDAISTAKLAAGAITAAKIGAGEVVAGKIAAGAVSTGELAAGAVTAAKIGAGEVVAGKIAAGAVSTNELAASSVTAAKIGAEEVTTSKIASGSITTDRIAAVAITAAKLATASVEADKIASNAVTTDKLAANSVVAGKIAAAAITAAAIGANEVIANTANLANAVVTGAKIADATIGTAKIGDAQITSAKIADANITTAKIGDLAVSTLKIADQAVTIPVSAYTAGAINTNNPAGGFMVLQSVVITSTGAPISILASCAWVPLDNFTFTFYIHRGSDIWQASQQSAIGGNMMTFAFRETPGVGTHTYELRVSWVSAFYQVTPFTKRFLEVKETKK